MKRHLAVFVALLCLLAGLNRAAAIEAVPVPVCPVSLTNPDGQELALERYDLRVAVHGPLALTEMEMVFRNPLPRQMEGRFLYLLPPGATVSRFAKEVGGRLMEGEVVEKLRAQRIYTEILHTMRDPALLEQDQGNRFSARVFPIPATGTVRLVLSYSQLLPVEKGERRLTVPLTGLPKMAEFNFAACLQALPGEKYQTPTHFIASGPRSGKEEDLQQFNYALKDFKPEEDLVLTFTPAARAAAVRVLRAGNYQMTCYRPESPPENRKLVSRNWALYFDTSASNADQEARRLEAAEKLLVALVPVLRQADRLFSAYAFDLDVAELMRPTSMNACGNGPLMPKVVSALQRRHCLGATNLEAALKHIGTQARAAKDPQCFVLITDGIATLGAREPRDLVAALGDWPAQHILHCLVLGQKQDEKALQAIVEKTCGRVVTLPLGERMAAEVPKVVAELQAPPGLGFEFYDEGAAWIYPRTFRDVRPGGELVVFSQVKDGAAAKPGVIRRGPEGKVEQDTPLSAPPAETPAFAPLLQREAHAAYLTHLERLEQGEANASKRAELRKQRVELSVKNRVLCPLTSLLVLETERDYARFGIERTALADILVVGAKGIELKHRAPEDVPLAPPIAKQSPPGRLKDERKLPEQAKPARTGADAAAAPVTSETEALYKKADATDRLEGLAFKTDATAGPGGGGGEALRESPEALQRQTGGAELGLANADGEHAADPARPFHGGGAAPAAPAPPPPSIAPPHPDRPGEPTSGERPAHAATIAPPPGDADRDATAGRPKTPDWTQQLTATVKPEELNALRAQVEAAPRDRRLRNNYADLLVKTQAWDNLQAFAFEWLPFDPENPQVYEFLGKGATGLKDAETALRAFTSIEELAPNRAALLARAGWLLLTAEKYAMAEQLFREALKNRQDDPNIYRGLSLSLVLKGDDNGAAQVLEDALKIEFHQRYGDVKRVLREELGYVFRGWLKKVVTHADAEHPRIQERARQDGVDLKATDALRVTLGWETDANDVDLHVVDPNGEECFYSHKQNASGLELYSDQTQGLGPEVIRCKKALPGTYQIGVNYFAAGPMGVSRGVVVICQPTDGVVEKPVIVPFCLVEGGADMRPVGTVKF